MLCRKNGIKLDQKVHGNRFESVTQMKWRSHNVRLWATFSLHSDQYRDHSITTKNLKKNKKHFISFYMNGVSFTASFCFRMIVVLLVFSVLVWKAIKFTNKRRLTGDSVIHSNKHTYNTFVLFPYSSPTRLLFFFFCFVMLT